MKPFGFALVGLDHWYNAFPMAEAIKAIDQAELRWVVGADETRARAVALQYGAPCFATHYEPVLTDPDVQVVTSFVSTDKSAELCIAAAQAGKHIISIKPMAMNLDEADHIVEVVNRTGVQYFPGSASHLFNSTYQVFEEWVSSGRIGKLLAASGVFHAGLPRDWKDSSTPGWFADPKRVPGGAWIDHAIFYLHLFRKWFDAEITSVEGIIGNRKYPHLAVEDFGQGIFTLANGAIVTATSTWLGAPGAQRYNLELFGSEGTLVWDSLLNKVAVAGDFGKELRGWIQIDRVAEPISRTASMVEHLINCIQTKTKPLCTAEDDRACLAAALAFYEAARVHQAVTPSV